MSPTVSVLIPTHNPDAGRLARTLDGLRAQTLPLERWELILVDNGSAAPVAPVLSWHPSAGVLREPRLGLTFARRAGAAAAEGALLVFVDDDNVLAPNYLARVVDAFARRPRLGALGGRSVPEWAVEPAPWVREFAGALAVRDLGDAELIADPSAETGYPACAPIGAGMALRTEAWADYARAGASGRGAITDRSGTSLASGGDCDVVLHVFRAGWQVGYTPELCLTHLLPAARLTREHLARLNHGIAKSWVQVLDRHGLRPWPRVARWTVPLRKWRAYLRYRSWTGPAAYVRWRGACGQFEGRALLGAP
ncbi:glycosyltransferase [Gemmata sp. JC673]|uniref:Glycosyltransferase n=1 Tax=Gemmata algarum TaxID=2975278 RepID=A0ABU5ETR8_9BACT|nr:glycosyltransferase [Gemmata algarum]MDY3557850.1 glycosyltransferase [Gemmata algarum]